MTLKAGAEWFLHTRFSWLTQGPAHPGADQIG